MREIREPAKSSKYYLPTQAYQTVFHYCRQYQEWKDELEALEPRVGATQYDGMPHGSRSGDKTCTDAIRRVEIKKKIQTLEDSVKEVDSDIYKWLLKGVTENLSYKYLRSVMGIPCGKNRYFDSRRRLYYLMARRM